MIAGYNADPNNAAPYQQALDGYLAAGLIDQGTYNSTKNLLKPPSTTTNTTPSATTDTTNTTTDKKTTTTDGTIVYNRNISPNAGGGYKY